VWYVVIFRIPLQTSKNTAAKLDGPMTCGYGIDAIDAARENQSASNAAVNLSECARGHDILKPRCHWRRRDETRVGRPWTDGHAFWNPELANAED
jgi:hypothetical protein